MAEELAQPPDHHGCSMNYKELHFQCSSHLVELWYPPGVRGEHFNNENLKNYRSVRAEEAVTPSMKITDLYKHLKYSCRLWNLGLWHNSICTIIQSNCVGKL